MRLPKFEYLAAHSVQEACSLLEQHSGEARLLAGGTDLLVAMKLRSVTPRYLIGLKTVPGMDSIAVADDTISLGPMLTLSAIATSPVLHEALPALAQAANRAASPELRASATLGGNICLDNRCTYYNQSDMWRRNWEACIKYGGERCYIVKSGIQCYALACADTVPALLALDSSLRLVNAAGERLVPLEQFFTGKGDVPNVLQQGEVLQEVLVPRPKPGSSSAFQKMARRASIDFPLLDVAVALRHVDGKCRDVRIALSAVGPAPVRARAAEQVIEGRPLSAATIAEAASQASKEAGPISAIGTTVAYRRQMITVLVRRTLQQLAQPNGADR